MREPLDIGGGVAIDPVSLRTVVVDEAAFASGIGSSTNPADQVLAALVTGRLEDAEQLVAASWTADPPFRLRALAADLRSARSDHAGAIDGYRALLAETVGGPREAVVRQHLGKALFAAGRLTAAQEQFELALRRREAAGAAADLLASSRLALDRVRELLAGA